MTRTVDEWIGKTSDSAIPDRVRLRVFRAYDGRCYLTGRKIGAGEAWDMDHVVAIINGGENRESNLAPVLKAPHKAKTASDIATKAKTERMARKHLGLFGNKRKWPSRGFDGRPSKKTLRAQGSTQSAGEG